MRILSPVSQQVSSNDNEFNGSISGSAQMVDVTQSQTVQKATVSNAKALIGSL